MADSRVSGPSRKEWEARKPVIKQLYIDEGRPLSNVMDIMAREHHFVAPPRAYKRRLKAWAFRKNIAINEDDTPLLLEAISRASSEDIHLPDGRVVSIERVASHLKRKGVELPQESRIPSSSLSSHSPRYHQALRLYSRGSSSSSSNSSSSDSEDSPRLSLSSLAIDPPDVYKLVGRLFADTRLYNQTKTAAGAAAPSDLMTVPDPNWFQTSVAVSTTRHLLELDHCTPALGLLRALPRQLNQVLRNDSPRALGQVFTVIKRLMAPSSPSATDVTTAQVGNVIRALVRYLAATANEEEPSSSPASSAKGFPHPVFRRILVSLASLSRLDDESLYEAATRAMSHMAEYYGTLLKDVPRSPESKFTWGLWLDFIDDQFTMIPGVVAPMRRLHQEKVARHGGDSWEATQPLFWVGFYQEVGRKTVQDAAVEAELENLSDEELQAIWEQVLRVGGVTDPQRTFASTPGSSFALRKSAHFLAVANYSRGERAQAEKYMRLAMGLLIKCDGPEANLAVLLRLCTTLQRWFMEWEEIEKAEEMRQSQVAILQRIETATWAAFEKTSAGPREGLSGQQGQPSILPPQS